MVSAETETQPQKPANCGLLGLVSQFGQLYRWFPSILKAITIVRPETLVQWHRAVFRRPFAE